MRALPQVAYVPDFVEQPDQLTTWLATEVRWQDEHIQLFGKRHKVPRQVAWFGDPGLNYRYSGHSHLAQGWPPLLATLREQLRDRFAADANFVLANRYRNGADYMGWHRDDEPGLAATVISLSFGATRRFHLDAPNQEDGCDRMTYELPSGSALLHPGHWRHSLPKTAKPVAERYNLSFRLLG